MTKALSKAKSTLVAKGLLMIRRGVSARSGRATAYSETGPYRHQRYRYHRSEEHTSELQSPMYLVSHPSLLSHIVSSRTSPRPLSRADRQQPASHPPPHEDPPPSPPPPSHSH